MDNFHIDVSEDLSASSSANRRRGSSRIVVEDEDNNIEREELFEKNSIFSE